MTITPPAAVPSLDQHVSASAQIEWDVMSSVAYSDVIDFAIATDEIHRFLHNNACSVAANAKLE